MYSRVRGIAHAIPSSLDRAATESRQTVYCPLGHAWWRGESKAEKLEKQLAEARRRHQASRDLLAAEERSHAATRGHITRLKNRAAAGVLPRRS